MKEFLRQIGAILVLACVTLVMLYIGFAVLVVIIVVGSLAFVWYTWKFYRIRRALEQAVRQHKASGFSDVYYRKEENGGVIEGEFHEIRKNDET